MPVLDAETGKILEYLQLCRNLNYRKVRETSYCTELGRLGQGIGTGTIGPKKQRVAGTEIFEFVSYDNIPQEQHIQIT